VVSLIGGGRVKRRRRRDKRAMRCALRAFAA
jgi:hypothetical protein